MLKKVGILNQKYKGDVEKVKSTYKSNLGRKLNEEELETIEYFANGYEMDEI